MHIAPFSAGLQALLLMFQLMSARDSVSDRFYRALYAVLLTPGPVASGGRASMFLSLLFKAMKADVSARRCAAFAKRLLQVRAAPAGALVVQGPGVHWGSLPALRLGGRGLGTAAPRPLCPAVPATQPSAAGPCNT